MMEMIYLDSDKEELKLTFNPISIMSKIKKGHSVIEEIVLKYDRQFEY